MFKKAAKYIKISLSPIAFERDKAKLQGRTKKKDMQIEALQGKVNKLKAQNAEIKKNIQSKVEALRNQNSTLKTKLQSKIIKNIKLQSKADGAENQVIELYNYIQKRNEGADSNKYVYVRSNTVFGSSYKYFMCLQQKYGGLIIDATIGSLPDNLIKIKPKIGFVRGDYCIHYKDFLETGIPYVLIENDIASFRSGKEIPHEKEMIENATAIIFPSKHFKEYCEERYTLPISDVVHLKPLREDLDFEPLPKLPGKHLVYAGGIVSSTMKNGFYGTRAYHDIFKVFIEAGWAVHIYPTPNGYQYVDEYTKIGCVIHQSVPFRQLLKEMSQYTAGFQGFNVDGVPEASQKFYFSTVPNKSYDYLAAGIPTIGYNTGKEIAKIYEGKWGVVLEELDHAELKNLHTKLPEIIEDVRHSQVMENDLPVIDKILKKLNL